MITVETLVLSITNVIAPEIIHPLFRQDRATALLMANEKAK